MKSRVCFLWICLGTQAAFAVEKIDLTVLLKGVDEIAMPGVVGSLCVYGANARAIAVAEGDGGTKVPIIAAGELGRGRIVCCAHAGYLSPEIWEKGQTGRLISHLILWAAKLTEPQANRLRIGVVGEQPLVKQLESAGLSVWLLNGVDWSRRLQGIDVVLVHPRSLNKQEVTRLRRFVRSGGGLVMADAGWVWIGYDAQPGERLERDFAGNQLAGEAGILWASGNAKSPASQLLPVSAEVPELVHARFALDFLKRQPTRLRAGLRLQQAVGSLEKTLALLPVDDKQWLPDVEKLLQDRLGERVVPSARRPIRRQDVFARLQVALETRKALQTSLVDLSAHPYAESFPGLPPRGTRAKKKTVAIDTSRPRWHSTGLYARGGDIIRVTVPETAVSQGLRVRIGAHQDALWHKDAWKRAPEVTREFPITSRVTEAGSGFGGLVYVVVPQDCRLGTIRVDIDGAIEAPWYVHGQTTLTQWRKIREAPAPWAELASDKFIITVPSAAVRELNRPDEVLAFWDLVLDACADLATIPRQRPSPERFVTDVQISAGYMHAGYPIMAPIQPLAKEILDVQTLKQNGNWGIYHEIGHNHQQPEWTWDGLGEVTVNLFSMYVLDTINPGAPHHRMVQPDKLADMTRTFASKGKLEGPWAQLMPYIQLQRAFGWDPYKKVFAEYRALPADKKPKTLQARKDEWLIRFSHAVGKNLGPFYDYWKIGVSEQAKQQVQSLPEWIP